MDGTVVVFEVPLDRRGVDFRFEQSCNALDLSSYGLDCCYAVGYIVCDRRCCTVVNKHGLAIGVELDLMCCGWFACYRSCEYCCHA